MPYRDQVVRVTLGQLRGLYPPRRFRELRQVELSHAGSSTLAEIVTVGGVGCISRQRRWLRCPRCGRLVTVVGHLAESWGCRSCLGWRSRNRRGSTCVFSESDPTV
jgi:hypothetical protein